MKSDVSKVLHPVAGRPMISYVVEAVRNSGLRKVVLVVGYQSNEVQKCVGHDGIQFALQEPQLGTAHAVEAAANLFQGFSGDILILCGDVPLIRPSTIEDFIRFHELQGSRLTVMSAYADNPAGYGRMIRDASGTVVRIVEDRDANDKEKRIKEINTGIYLANSELVYSLLHQIRADNAQGEYYLTDMVREAVKESVPVQAFVLQDFQEASGINTRSELARASAVIWGRLCEQFMDSGVTLLDPASVYVDSSVQIGMDTIVHPSVTISGHTEIGRDCVIESGVYIIDSKLGDRVKILQGSRLNGAVVGDDTSVGPMAHLRPEARIGKSARIGNFVEVKKSVVGDGSKASHLTYLGDSTIGKQVNIGCGTITCNYDGKQKHPTTIHDGCFIGSDVQFVAPVEIGEGSVIGAGSTITRDVPPGSLAVSRAKQKIYPLRTGQGPGSSDKDRKP